MLGFGFMPSAKVIEGIKAKFGVIEHSVTAESLESDIATLRKYLAASGSDARVMVGNIDGTPALLFFVTVDKSRTSVTGVTATA